MTEDVTEPDKFPGKLWAQMGIHFVPKTFDAGGYTSLLKT